MAGAAARFCGTGSFSAPCSQSKRRPVPNPVTERTGPAPPRSRNTGLDRQHRTPRRARPRPFLQRLPNGRAGRGLNGGGGPGPGVGAAMGSAEGSDWVDVANDLCRTCHINQHIKHLSECGADLFVHLYESILGEKVPDFIATPRSQEDDAHNVQAVIDSLALDYLQVSLSHITGENIVKGDRESIKNLLEIFDGLLEYLREVSETSSQTGAEINVLPSDEIQIASQEQLESTADQLTEHTLLSSAERSQSEYFILTCDTDGSGSTSELIKLGDTAYSFSKRGEEKDTEAEESESTEALAALPRQFSESERGTENEREDGGMEAVPEAHQGSLGVSATKLGEPIQQAIPLLPPFQPSDPAWRDLHSSPRQAAALPCPPALTIPAIEKSLTQKFPDVSDELPLSRKIPGTVPLTHSYLSSASAVGEMLGGDAKDKVTKVPLVSESSISASSEEKLSLCAEQVTQTPRPESQHWPRTTSKYENSTPDSGEDSLSHRTTKEKVPKQQEFHEASENLARRLNELDLMLKRALGEHTRGGELPDEDSLSQHSDSAMDYGRRTAGRDTPRPRCPGRPRSLSPASPLSQHQEQKQRGRGGAGQIKTIRSHLQEERDERARKAKLVTKAYENELRSFEAREKRRISKLREAAKEMEQEYKENVFQEPPKVSQRVKVYSRKTTPQYPKHSQWIPKRGIMKPKQAAPMTIRDNDLLLQLLEEFPHLHISPRTLNKMWHQQLAQTEHLKAPSARPRPKLQNEVEQALKKHELLAAIIKRDQDHSKRLQEMKQRIQRQKWAQNKVTERRQQAARARKYYEDYRVQLRAKLLRARTREERIFKNLFEEGLEIQKQRLRDLRVYAQEKRDEQRREHQMELEALENYYRDQFSMLAEALSQEFQEIQTREKAQAQMLQKSKSEVRSKMEKEIQQLQAAIMHNDDDTFFQELEADRLRSRLQMASFQYSHSHF